MNTFVHAPCMGPSEHPKPGEDTIVMSFFGPRGGTRALVELRLEDARKLARELAGKIKEFDARTGFTSAGLVDSRLTNKTQ